MERLTNKESTEFELIIDGQKYTDADKPIEPEALMLAIERRDFFDVDMLLKAHRNTSWGEEFEVALVTKMFMDKEFDFAISLIYEYNFAHVFNAQLVLYIIKHEVWLNPAVDIKETTRIREKALRFVLCSMFMQQCVMELNGEEVRALYMKDPIYCRMFCYVVLGPALIAACVNRNLHDAVVICDLIALLKPCIIENARSSRKLNKLADDCYEDSVKKSLSTLEPNNRPRVKNTFRLRAMKRIEKDMRNQLLKLLERE